MPGCLVWQKSIFQSKSPVRKAACIRRHAGKQMGSFLVAPWMSCAWLGMSAQLFSADGFRKVLITFTAWCTSTEQKLSPCRRRLTNVSEGGESAGCSNLTEHYLARTGCFLPLPADVEHLFSRIWSCLGLIKGYKAAFSGAHKKSVCFFLFDFLMKHVTSAFAQLFSSRSSLRFNWKWHMVLYLYSRMRRAAVARLLASCRCCCSFRVHAKCVTGQQAFL